MRVGFAWDRGDVGAAQRVADELMARPEVVTINIGEHDQSSEYRVDIRTALDRRAAVSAAAPARDVAAKLGIEIQSLMLVGVIPAASSSDLGSWLAIRPLGDRLIASARGEPPPPDRRLSGEP